MELLVVLLLFNRIATIVTQTWTNAKDDYSFNVLDVGGGAETIHPVTSLSSTVTVNVDLNIASINNFDDTNGFMDISGYLDVEWTSQVLTASAFTITELVPHTAMWKPPILFVNALKQSEEIGSDSTTKIRYNFRTLQCTWQPWFVLRGACSPDVKYYPFDKQECSFTFAAWGYQATEVIFQPKNSVVGFPFFEENGSWEVTKTTATSKTVNGISVVEFKISVSRRPLYHVINLLGPVILLGLLNVFVFLLPIDSGERVGFAMTCVLAYVVLLNTVIVFLPESSLAISYLSYYTFVMMIFSAGMSLATVLTVRISFKPENDKVPKAVQYFILIITCKLGKVCKSSGIKVTKVEPANKEKRVSMWSNEQTVAREATGAGPSRNQKVISPVSCRWDDDLPSVESDDGKSDGYFSRTESDGRTATDDGKAESGDSSNSDNTDKDNEVTWKDVSHILDWFLFFGFLGGQIFYSVAYLVPIFTRA